MDSVVESEKENVITGNFHGNMNARVDEGVLHSHPSARLMEDDGRLPQFPADSAFIEHEARFSCFNGGNIVLNSLSIPYSNGLAPLPRSLEVLRDKGSGKSVNLSQSIGEEETEVNNRELPEKLEVAEMKPSGIGFGSKRRKRNFQSVEDDEAFEASIEMEKVPKRDYNSTSTSKPKCKNGGQEDYVHVRARRGQATNSHSLAERARREKISERMKYLQDLVPGCNKVTGKAVILDEIINYVQSLQRQVEFLSMKLATVNQQIDFNDKTFLAKNAKTCLPRPSMTAYPSLQGLFHSDILGSDKLLRSINL